jgi:hypothetical protein
MSAGGRHAAVSRQSGLRAVRGALSLALSLLPVLVAPPARSGDLETQAWGNFTLGWIRSEKLYLELDLEPKVLVSGEPKWRNLDVTTTAEYYPNSWLDVVGEVTAGSTLQTDDLRTNELTLRAGARMYLLNNVRDKFHFGHTPLSRVSLATLIRLEERNFWYSDDTDSQQSFRFRARVEFKAPINHADLTADRTYYVLADAEGYVPVGDEIDERYASKYRARLGLGYRINGGQRVDLLYIRDRVQDTIEDGPRDSLQAFDVRYRVVFR